MADSSKAGVADGRVQRRGRDSNRFDAVIAAGEKAGELSADPSADLVARTIAAAFSP